MVGTPVITHGRSKIGAWGVTALNPDVTDLFVEYARYDSFLSSDKKKWEEAKFINDTIKVRFGKDIDLKIMFSRNGVIIPTDFIDCTAQDIMPWITNDLF